MAVVAPGPWGVRPRPGDRGAAMICLEAQAALASRWRCGGGDALGKSAHSGSGAKAAAVALLLATMALSLAALFAIATGGVAYDRPWIAPVGCAALVLLRLLRNDDCTALMTPSPSPSGRRAWGRAQSAALVDVPWNFACCLAHAMCVCIVLGGAAPNTLETESMAFAILLTAACTMAATLLAASTTLSLAGCGRHLVVAASALLLAGVAMAVIPCGGAILRACVSLAAMLLDVLLAYDTQLTLGKVNTGSRSIFGILL